MTETELIKDLSAKVKSGQETVAYIIKERWSERGYKKLLGVKGEQVAEYDDGVLCSFPAKELLREAINTLPRMTIAHKESAPKETEDK